MALLESSGRLIILVRCFGVAAGGIGIAALLPTLLRHVAASAAVALFELGASMAIGSVIVAIRRVSCPICRRTII
jgi:hypothetical protein